jgi:hypothetical protein
MKKVLLITFISLFTIFNLLGQDCTQESKAQLAKNNMSSDNDGLMCENAAQFYAYLCECENKPRTAEQAKMLKATLEEIKRTYNDYGAYCNGIGRIYDNIPNCKVGNSSNTSSSGESIPSYYQNLNGTPDNLFESVNKEFNPEGYRGISYSKTMKEQGSRIVNSLTQKVEQYSQLIATDDPAALLADFQSKFSTLEAIEKNYEKESFAFGLQRGRDLGNQINNKDYEGAFINSISFLNSLGEMRRGEKELEERKKALEQQKNSQMFAIYKKTWEKNNELLQTYRERAAYAESLKDEQNNFQYVFHQVCYMDDMTDRINLYDDWYVNRCETPKPSYESELTNNLISRDQQLLNVANRKYDLYKKYDEAQIYLDAAISFTAAAVKENPTAENYLALAKLYAESSNILSLVSLESSKSIKESLYANGPNLEFYNQVKSAATNEVKNAIVENNINYLQSFINVGLHNTVQLEGKTLFSYALTLDMPDAVQAILNYEATKLDQTALQKKLTATFNLAAFLNSANTIARLKELGVSIKNTGSKRNPIDYAVDGLSPNAIIELQTDAEYKAYFNSKYGSHPVQILIRGLDDPILGAMELTKLSESNTKAVSKRLLELAPTNNKYYDLLGYSPQAQAIIRLDEKMMNELIQRFEKEIILPSPLSMAHLIWRTGLIKEEEINISSDGINPINLESIKTFQGLIWNMTGSTGLLQIGLTKSPDHFQNNTDYDGYGFALKRIAYYYEEIRKINYSDEHLSTMAYFFSNGDLFREIDKTQDLSNVKLSTGQGLLDIMLLEESFSTAPPIGMTPQFLSKDFDVSKSFEGTTYLLKIIEQVANSDPGNVFTQFDNSHVTESKNRDSDLTPIQLSILKRMSHENHGGIRNYPLSAQFSKELAKANFITSVLEKYDLSINSKLSKTGGTLLHWAIDNSGKPKAYVPEELEPNYPLINASLALGVDPKIEDDSGQNVFDYMLSNKKSLKSIKGNLIYLYPDNGTFNKGSLKSSFDYFEYMFEDLK